MSRVTSLPQHAIVLVGTYPPRRCGIGTFTCDLHAALRDAAPANNTAVICVGEADAAPSIASEVAFTIRREVIEDYVAAAAMLNQAKARAVCIQHEYGIYGGAAGAHILALIQNLDCPIVVTLHTVLETPNGEQRAVMDAMAASVDRLVVMAKKAKTLLTEIYGIGADKIALIPHGAPDCALESTRDAKKRLGFEGRDLLLTFGLLSANKGIETMLRAMPAVVDAAPNACYVVLGATHPNVLAAEGEAYRERLIALAGDLGVGHAVVFENSFVDRPKLIQFLRAADIYVTPYLNAAQITSGTLSYAVALGRPVISTPYWHAQELLAGGRGVLVPFSDSDALSAAAVELLLDPALRQKIARNAYASGRAMIWSSVAADYLQLFEHLSGQTVESPAASDERAFHD